MPFAASEIMKRARSIRIVHALYHFKARFAIKKACLSGVRRAALSLGDAALEVGRLL
jgi:hypothetical protein